MVRFKVAPNGMPAPAILCFNSQMVRFKVTGSGSVLRLVSSFNSQMVRFKVNFPKLRFIIVDPFQFPNGTIQSSAYLIARRVRIRFQFPNGTIQSMFDFSAGTEVISFNSQMVRFKVDCQATPLANTTEFQFPNGTIQSLSGVSHDIAFTKFQFPNGTIQSLS